MARTRFIRLSDKEPGAGELRDSAHYNAVKGVPRIYSDEYLIAKGRPREKTEERPRAPYASSRRGR